MARRRPSDQSRATCLTAHDAAMSWASGSGPGSSSAACAPACWRAQHNASSASGSGASATAAAAQHSASCTAAAASGTAATSRGTPTSSGPEVHRRAVDAILHSAGHNVAQGVCILSHSCLPWHGAWPLATAPGGLARDRRQCFRSRFATLASLSSLAHEIPRPRDNRCLQRQRSSMGDGG